MNYWSTQQPQCISRELCSVKQPISWLHTVWFHLQNKWVVARGEGGRRGGSCDNARVAQGIPGMKLLCILTGNVVAPSPQDIKLHRSKQMYTYTSAPVKLVNVNKGDGLYQSQFPTVICTVQYIRCYHWWNLSALYMGALHYFL